MALGGWAGGRASSFGPEGSSAGVVLRAALGLGLVLPFCFLFLSVYSFQSTQARLEFAAILLPPVLLGAGITGVHRLDRLFRFSAGF